MYRGPVAIAPWSMLRPIATVLRRPRKLFSESDIVNPIRFEPCTSHFVLRRRLQISRVTTSMSTLPASADLTGRIATTDVNSGSLMRRALSATRSSSQSSPSSIVSSPRSADSRVVMWNRLKKRNQFDSANTSSLRMWILPMTLPHGTASTSRPSTARVRRMLARSSDENVAIQSQVGSCASHTACAASRASVAVFCAGSAAAMPAARSTHPDARYRTGNIVRRYASSMPDVTRGFLPRSCTSVTRSNPAAMNRACTASAWSNPCSTTSAPPGTR